MKKVFEKIKSTVSENQKIVIVVVVGLLLLAFAIQSVSHQTVGEAKEESVGLNSLVSSSVAPSVMMDMSDGGYEYVESKKMQVPGVPIPPMEYTEGQYEPDEPRRLIRNGSLSMTVQDIENTRSKITTLVASMQGYVSQENFSDMHHYDEYGEQHLKGRSGNTTIKVPGENFEVLMQSLRSLALTVTSENSNVQDVTEQYADLETRLLNKKREEEQYRAILKKAVKISDVLEVTKYLENTRGEVERLQGQLNVLSNKVSMATINVYLESEQSFAIGGVSWNPGQQLQLAWQSLLKGLVVLFNKIIGWIVLLPLVLLYVVVYSTLGYVVYRAGRWVYGKITHD